jgi:hypothetical protein
MAKKISKTSSLLQKIYKEYWRALKNGGMVLEYLFEKSGENILIKTNLRDIKPNTKYYMQSAWKSDEFIPTTFDPKVEWKTIEELHKTGRIWQLIQE